MTPANSNAPTTKGKTPMNRALASVTVRSIDEEQRKIFGWASRPDVDRVGDIVEPLGASWAASGVPLLMGHDHALPVGRVTFGKATAQGIPFEATIPKIDEPGLMQQQTNAAWHAVKYKILDSVSIGFRVIGNAVEKIETGFRYLRTEILELSLVAVPAAPGARITATKQAARGGHVVRLGKPAGKSHSGHVVVRLSDDERRSMHLEMAIAESRARRKRLGIPLPVVKLNGGRR